MHTPPVIVGLGEALFDIFPDEARLGGAPLNMAVHAHQLGNRGVVVSRVGQDALGERIATELHRRGMTTEHLQTDPDLPTGTVKVELDERGEPSYDILRNVAWDALQFDPDTENLARRCDAVCFGTLAQREAQTRNTIYRFLETARQAVRLLDVNLRQHSYDRRIVERSCELATAVKLNAPELGVLTGLFNLPAGQREAVQGLLSRFENLKWVAVTLGKMGTTVHSRAYQYQAEPVAAGEGGDAVGAGDAAAAALLHGVLGHWPWEKTLKLANALGAEVASQKGACPPLGEGLKGLAAGG